MFALRRCGLVVASLAISMVALIGGGGGQALAISAGCAAIANFNFPSNGTVSGVFDAGDQISITVNFVYPPASGSFPQYTFSGSLAGGGSGFPSVSGASSVSVSFTAAAGNGSLTLTAAGGGGKSAQTTGATCTPAPVVGPPTDSQNLRNVQTVGTQIIATNSGAAITGAVTGAIGDAFSPTGGAPITGGPNGFTANFAAEPQASDVSTRADDAFAALGYAKSPSYKAPPRLVQEWSAWLDVRGSGFDRGSNTNPTDIRATQVNVTGGVGRKITPDFLVGIFGGYENANVTMNAINGRLNADGGTVGGYTAWRFAPRWRIDALGGWTGLNYSASAGAASGTFNGSRFIGAGGLTGTYDLTGFVFEPSSNVYVLTEREGSWTDSLGTLQAARTFTVGRVATGAKLAAVPYGFMGNIKVSPYVGFYGDWRFATDNALPVAVTLVGINNGWSGRATGGLAFTSSGGASLTLGGEYGGIGAPYKIWAGNVRGSVPF